MFGLLGVDFPDPDSDTLALMHRVKLVAASLTQLSLLLEHIVEQMPMRISAVRWVSGIFLALQPIAVEHVDRDLTDRVGPDQQVPARYRRRGQGTHIGKHQSAEFLNRIAFQFLFYCGLR